MQTVKIFFKDKTNVIGFIIAFFGAYMMIPNYFEANLYPIQSSKELWMSLDPSWGIGLNYVKIKNLTWGTDFAFTYGPLAHFCTRVGWGSSKLSFLIFDFFMFINFFALYAFSFYKSKNKISTLILILLVTLIMPLWIGAANSLILLAFLVFWIRLSLDSTKPIFYVFQILILILLFFLKFNTGLIAFPFFVVGIFCNFYYTRNKSLLLYLIIPVILILLLSSIFNVQLISYITSGLEIVSGYNDVMYLENQIPGSFTYLLIIIMLLLLLLTINIFKFGKQYFVRFITILFLFCTSIFVLYKQAFVRADQGHIKEFFMYVFIIVLCNVDLHIKHKFKFLNFLFIGTLLIPVYFLLFTQNYNVEFNKKLTKSEYISSLKKFTSTSGLTIFSNSIEIPFSIKQKITKSTVDIFPWNIQSLLENKLNYLPRPVFQSYSAYTPYLENMNFEHYNSEKSPEFVIYDFASIDGRYPLFDESKVSLSLLLNYTLVEEFIYDNRKLLLLQRKVNFKKIVFQKLKEYAMELHSPLVPKKGIYYEIGIYNNFKGKIISALEHAPEINLEIKTSDGQKIVFRTSKSLLKTGIFSKKYIKDNQNFSSFINNYENNLDVIFYNFAPIKPNMFKDKIKITEYKITQ
jgi:hypothetical protein